VVTPAGFAGVSTVELRGVIRLAQVSAQARPAPGSDSPMLSCAPGYALPRAVEIRRARLALAWYRSGTAVKLSV
jgi:hypothetical protein